MSSFLKSHQNTQNSVKYEGIWKWHFIFTRRATKAIFTQFFKLWFLEIILFESFRKWIWNSHNWIVFSYFSDYISPSPHLWNSRDRLFDSQEKKGGRICYCNGRSTWRVTQHGHWSTYLIFKFPLDWILWKTTPPARRLWTWL